MTRGDVYRVRLPRQRGREQHGARYAVIVQADEFMPLSTVVVAPTSTQAVPSTFRPTVEVQGRATRVLVEQLRSLHVDRLGERSGRLDADEQRSVDGALRLVLGLD